MSKLAIIAGHGELPKTLISACKKAKRSFVIVSLEGLSPALKVAGVETLKLRAERVDDLFKALHGAKVKRVVMAGGMKRPALSRLKPDMRGMKVISKLALNGVGDDGLLKLLANEFSKEKIKIVAAQDIAPEILAPKGVLSKLKADKNMQADIARAKDVLKAMGKADVGQAVIVQEGHVIAIEAAEGTDALIKRSADLLKNGKGGVLVKMAKPGQSKKMDLPTIGPQTISAAAKAGLKGVFVQAGSSIILDQAKAVQLANQHKLVLAGI